MSDLVPASKDSLASSLTPSEGIRQIICLLPMLD